MPLHFLVDAPLPARPDGTVVLTGAEAHHAAAVRRVRVGERVTVGDGAGAWASGEVESVAPKAVVVRLADVAVLPAPSPRVVLVQALAKGDRDCAVAAATELGADEIVPWQGAQRSGPRGLGRGVEKGGRRAAARAWPADRARGGEAGPPRVAAARDRPRAATRDLPVRAGTDRVLVLEPTASARFSGIEIVDGDPRALVLVVGPGGGVAPDELEALAAADDLVLVLVTPCCAPRPPARRARVLLNARLGRW